MAKESKSSKELWREAIKNNDIELAIEAAKLLGGTERLKSIIIETWAKKQFSMVAKASEALGFKLGFAECSCIEGALKEVNGKRAKNTLQVQDVLECLILSCQKQECIVRTSPGGLIYIVLEQENIDIFIEVPDLAMMKKFNLQTTSIHTFYMPDFCKDLIANKAPSAITIALVKTLKIKSPKKPDLVQLAWDCLARNNNAKVWEQFCTLLSKWDQDSKKLDTQQIKKIEHRLKSWPSRHRLLFDGEYKLPALFSRMLVVISHVYFSSPRKYLKLSRNPHVEPLTHLLIDTAYSNLLAAFLNSPYFKNITSLTIETFDCYGARQAYDDSPWLFKIKTLTLGMPHKTSSVNEAENQTLSILQKCSQLEEINLCNLDIDKKMAKILGELKQLKSLCFSSNITHPGVMEFLKQISSGQLKKLEISFGCIVPQTLKKLLSSPKLKSLEVLKLQEIEIDESVAKVLAQSPYLTNLKRLSISPQKLNSNKKIWELIAKSPYLCNLTYLSIQKFKIEEDTATHIASSQILKNLETLQLSNTALRDKALAIILDSPNLANLKHLSLAINKITAPGLQALYKMTSLVSLDLRGNKIKAAGGILAKWPGLANLELLNVTGCQLDKKGREALCISPYFQKADIKGIPEYPEISNWRKMDPSQTDDIYESMSICGQRKEIIAKVQEQVFLWAERFKIVLDFSCQENAIKVNMADLGKSVFARREKDSFGEPVVSDYEYEASLLEEAKRKLADKYQEHITNIYFQN